MACGPGRGREGRVHHLTLRTELGTKKLFAEAWLEMARSYIGKELRATANVAGRSPNYSASSTRGRRRRKPTKKRTPGPMGGLLAGRIGARQLGTERSQVYQLIAGAASSAWPDAAGGIRSDAGRTITGGDEGKADTPSSAGHRPGGKKLVFDGGSLAASPASAAKVRCLPEAARGAGRHDSTSSPRTHFTQAPPARYTESVRK